MSGAGEGLLAHLQSGASEVARCWRVTRADGVSFGFTDHDVALEFESTVFKADTGLSAAALSQTTGLSVDNTEAVGALSDAAITEEDILAGRFDGAVVEAWLVNWSAPENRALQFKGSFGELERPGGRVSGRAARAGRTDEPARGAGLSKALCGRFGRSCLWVRSCGPGLCI